MGAAEQDTSRAEADNNTPAGAAETLQVEGAAGRNPALAEADITWLEAWSELGIPLLAADNKPREAEGQQLVGAAVDSSPTLAAAEQLLELAA